jgi:signal peptidase I
LVTFEAPDHVVEGLLDIWREQGRVSEIVVYGRSMEPMIPRGARLVVSHAPESLVPGDIVVYKNRDHLTAHRIVEILEAQDGARQYRTKGDANDETDPPIAEPLILGKVMEILRPRSSTESLESEPISSESD